MKFLLALLFFPTMLFASDCDHLFPNGKEIVVQNAKILCNSFFVTVYDERNVANIFSAEIAQSTRNRVDRTNDFRPDERLKRKAQPQDYTRSGYDRGHMVPAADADELKEMSDTFLMTNMTPQVPSVNRESWRELEEQVRTKPYKYILTGAIYNNNPKRIGLHMIPVPTHLYKIVYLDTGTEAYIVDNAMNAKVQRISIQDLQIKLNFKL